MTIADRAILQVMPMGKKVFLEDLQDYLKRMKKALKPFVCKVELTGGLRERGYTSHDIDLDLNMRYSQAPSEDVVLIVSEYGNEFWEKYHLELDVNFLYRRKPRYKLDKDGFWEYQDDGSLEPTSL